MREVTLEEIKKMAAGVHIMPLNDIDTSLEIINHLQQLQKYPN